MKKGEKAHNRIEHRIIAGVRCKRCSRCQKWLPLDCFNKQKDKWDGLQIMCRECKKQHHKIHKEEDNQKSRERYYKNNKEKYRKAKQKKEELIKSKWGTVCKICGCELFGKTKRKRALHHVSYICLKQYPGKPANWGIEYLKKVPTDCLMLLCHTCHHKLIHTLLNYQKWNRPSDTLTIINKLKALYLQGKLNWTHTKPMKREKNG